VAEWRKAPAYTTIRGIDNWIRLGRDERRRSASCGDRWQDPLRRSFENFLDRRAAHILSAFASDTALVLAHLDRRRAKMPGLRRMRLASSAKLPSRT
jgi:hypothetical protein